MTERFAGKYRIESNRLKGWNYANEGSYFITLVTQNRECNLGKIQNGEMALSDWGNIVNDEWLKSFEIRQELFCDEYVIMPNHIHAIVILENNHVVVDTHGRAYQQQRPPTEPQSANPSFFRMPQSISSFIAGFKSGVNSKIDDYIDENHLNIPKYNRHNHFFQPNYHDHIIRNREEYLRIKNYIINNPKNWTDDSMNAQSPNKPADHD